MKHNLSALTVRSTAAWVRSSRPRVMATALLAARIVTAPVPVANAATLAAATGDDAIPPSTLATVSFSPTAADSLDIVSPALQTVQVGDSLATQQAQQAAQAAALAAQQQAVVQAAKAAEQRAAAQAAQVQAEQQEAQTAAAASPDSTDLYDQLYAMGVADMGVQETQAMLYIAEHESGVRLDAVNVHSGACGIWQADPCSKMGGMDLAHQYAWVKRYAYARYGSFVNAQAHWEVYKNW